MEIVIHILIAGQTAIFSPVTKRPSYEQFGRSLAFLNISPFQSLQCVHKTRPLALSGFVFKTFKFMNRRLNNADYRIRQGIN